MIKERIQPDDETSSPQHLKERFGSVLASFHRSKGFRKGVFLKACFYLQI